MDGSKTASAPKSHQHSQRARLKAMIVSVGLGALAGCATPPPPPPPPPPPAPPPPAAPVEATPYRPIPPGGAAYIMEIPPLNAAGQRITINDTVSDEERVWHFRSAWNVAALNCLGDPYGPIVEGYRRFNRNHTAQLGRINTRIERDYRRREGSRRAALLAREEHMTQVYNFFALPSARGDFCRAMLAVALEARDASPFDPKVFALANFARLEVPFDRFFAAYEGYERAAAEWDARYGELYGPSQPGWVAVQKARAKNGALPSATGADPGDTLSAPAEVTATVTDTETGAAVPIIPVEEGFVSQPVVEPLPSKPPSEEGG